MPRITIERSISIETPADKIYKVVSDFNEWQPWSPWLLMEPEAKVTVADDARSYEWEGKRSGTGHMRIDQEKENESVHYELNFLKPWKSSSKTSFHLHQEGQATKVTWKMESSLPYFLFWMKKAMEAFVGADYERGLDMLKAYVENGEVPSRLEFKGFSEFSGCKWIGIRSVCTLDETATMMPEDFGKLRAYADQHTANMVGEALSIYHKWDLVKKTVDYTAAIQVKDIPQNLTRGFISGIIPTAKIYTLRHIGRYHHLGNGWSTLYSMHRNKEFKLRKDISPFEIYRNNPSETPDNELITDINFAVK